MGAGAGVEGTSRGWLGEEGALALGIWRQRWASLSWGALGCRP